MTADSVLIAGAGIGGLTAALALARQGLRVILFDQMEKLEEAAAKRYLRALRRLKDTLAQVAGADGEDC